MLHENLLALRKLNHLTQEEVAEKIGVSRQAVAKWENGLSVPDIYNCVELAKLYDVALDDLINHEDGHKGAMIAPKGKHMFGTVKVGEKGQIVIPKKAREIFGIQPGDDLVLLGDEEQGLAMIRAEDFMKKVAQLEDLLDRKG